MSPPLVRKIGYATFFALLAIVIAGYLLFPRGSAKPQGSLIAETGAEHIVRIEISRQGDPYSVALNRIDGAWNLAIDKTYVYPARTEKIAALLHSLTQKRTLAGVGKMSEENAGIGINGAYSMALFFDGESQDGANSASMHFGVTDATGKWMFAKKEPDGAIFRTESDIEGFLDIRASSWAKLAIFTDAFAKNAIQRIVFTKNGSVRQFIAGKDSAIRNFESLLSRMECLDVTNLKSDETEFIELEFGDLKTVRIGLAPLGDVWILSNSGSGGLYIISDETKRELENSLGAD